MELSVNRVDRGDDVKSESKLQEYLVALRLPEDEAMGRVEVAEQNKKLGTEFRRHLLRMIDEQHLDAEVGCLGEPLNLPFVSIEATDRVAEIVRAMPEVDSVLQDGGFMERIF
jgi:hypothetical protein